MLPWVFPGYFPGYCAHMLSGRTRGMRVGEKLTALAFLLNVLGLGRVDRPPRCTPWGTVRGFVQTSRQFGRNVRAAVPNTLPRVRPDPWIFLSKSPLPLTH